MDLLQQLGLEVSQHKLVAPSTAVICLGILVDFWIWLIKPFLYLIKICKEWLSYVDNNLCKNWATKSSCTKNQLQSLLGSLLYITKCVRPARFFLNRMPQILGGGHVKIYVYLISDFHKDRHWFNTFLCSYNRVPFDDTKQVHATITLDESLAGLGAVHNDMAYALPIPQGFCNYTLKC